MYGPIDLGLNLARSLTLLYPYLAELSEKPYHLPENSGISFFINIAFLLVLIVYFQESSDVCHLIEC